MQILLVEDSPEVSLITVEYLTELGHEAVAVTDAELAVQELAHRRFDLAKAVSRDYPKLPIVISSGYGAQNISSLLGERDRYVLVLSKPYDMDMLEKTLLKAAAFAGG
jgi:DNA-binding NtrC family response regulator